MQLEESYIVGLIDGEGTISVVRYPDGRVRPQVLVFNSFRRVLELLKETLQLKAPILEASRVDGDIKRKKTTYRLQIRAKDDVKKVFEILERHPPIIKHEDYRRVLDLTQSWLAN